MGKSPAVYFHGYLVDLCVSGRLEARTMEMKQAVSRLPGKEALSFNDEVAKLYERLPNCTVRTRVFKIGNLSLDEIRR